MGNNCSKKNIQSSINNSIQKTANMGINLTQSLTNGVGQIVQTQRETITSLTQQITTRRTEIENELNQFKNSTNSKVQEYVNELNQMQDSVMQQTDILSQTAEQSKAQLNLLRDSLNEQKTTLLNSITNLPTTPVVSTPSNSLSENVDKILD